MNSDQSSGTNAAAPVYDAAVARMDPALPVLVLGHNDADGLSATAIFVRALRVSGRVAEHRIVGRGESPWSAAMREELGGRHIGGLIITDLGVRDTIPVQNIPALIVDHHVPGGAPDGAFILSGHGLDPSPTSSLLAYRCVANAVPDRAPLLWLAALGMIGDMAEDAGFPEMSEARTLGITALRQAAALINAPRRASSGDAAPALALLLDCAGPKEILSGSRPEVARLHEARDEVRAELDRARRIAPEIRNGVALIRFASATQIHPLLAQQWRGRLRNEIVLAANTGFREGWVHFAARSGRKRDLIKFLEEHRPPGADENYGSGHMQATGGALRLPDWEAFLSSLGFSATERLVA